MIISNINNSLPENVENDNTFLMVKSPKLFLRYFKARISVGETIRIPYYVVDNFMDDKGRFFNPNTNRNEFIHTTKDTFTTIVTIRPNSEIQQPKVFKKTTYSGEQYIDVGPFNEDYIGVCDLDIRCIQNDGTGSATQVMKVLVEDPNELITTIDLNVTDSFQSSFSGDNAHVVPTEYNTVTNGSTKYKMRYRRSYMYTKVDDVWDWRWGNPKVPDDAPKSFTNPSFCVDKVTIVADYNVSVVKTQDGDIDYIKITVGGSPDTNSFQDKGYKYRVDANRWIKSTIYGKYTIEAATGKEDISGDYYLRTRCEINDNGVIKTVRLVDYVPKQPNELPPEVVEACMRNKLALTRLMEAARALSEEGKVKLILPKMPIVIDRHRINPYGVIVPDDGDIAKVYYDTPVDPVELPDVYALSWQIELQDKFILDLHSSIIYGLQSSDIKGGTLIQFHDNFDSHIINGNIHGPYKYLNYASQQGNVENLASVRIIGSSFCTMKNIDIAYAQGYDLNFVEDSSISTWTSDRDKSNYTRKFNYAGYINYDGDVIDYPYELPDFAFALRSNRFACDTTSDSKYLKMGSRLLLNNMCFQVINVNHANEHGNRSKSINKEVFLHYYKLVDNNKWVFLKTEKDYDFSAITPPEGTTHIFLSSWGNIDPYKVTDRLRLSSLYNPSYNGGVYDIDYFYPCWSCGLIDCAIHDNRSSILDNTGAFNCYMENCLTWNLGAERQTVAGGSSNQSLYVDMEDGNIMNNCNFYLNNVDNIYGHGGFQIHSVSNLLFNKVKNVIICGDKGVFGITVKNSALSIKVGHGYSNPVRYDFYRNNILDNFENRATKISRGSRGESDLKVNIEGSTVFTLTGQDLEYTDNIYVKECNIID